MTDLPRTPPRATCCGGWRLADEAAKDGLRVKTGVEPEFFLLTPEGLGVRDPHDTAVKPCNDQQAAMRRYDVITEVCDYMLALGWAGRLTRTTTRLRSASSR